MSRIAAVHGVLAPHRHDQREITDLMARTCLRDGSDRGLLDRLHASARVTARHTVLPLDAYDALDGFGAVNDAYIDAAVELGAAAVDGALREAGVSPEEVDLLVFTSVTGIAAPSVDARLVGRLGLRPDVKRVPVFGLGCVAGAAGLGRVHDYLRGWPDHVAVLLSVELCSLTFQRDDPSVANLVAGGLFGDGAAAAVCCGAERRSIGDRRPGPDAALRHDQSGPEAALRHDQPRPDAALRHDRPRPGGRGARARAAHGPTIVATRSHLYPGTEGALGWDITGTGFRVVIDSSVPDLVRRHLPDEVDAFLGEHDLKRHDVAAWVCHPGGPRVLEAVAEALDLPGDALDLTWRSLDEVGNLSSASVLHILRDTLAERPPEPGTPGLLLAFGPGFCSELVLLRW